MTTPANNIPAPNAPMIDRSTGLITQVWWQFLLTVFNKIGAGGDTPDLSAIVSQLQNLQFQTDFQSVALTPAALIEAQRGIEDLFSQLPSSQNLTDLNNRLDVLEGQVQASLDLAVALRRIEELESLLMEIRPAQTVLEQWNAPTLQNSWVNFGGSLNPAGYWKDPHNVVHLRGVVMSGTVTATMFVLPAGYRPANEELFSIASNNAFGRLDVRAAGDVVLVTGSNSFASLDGITFRAAT